MYQVYKLSWLSGGLRYVGCSMNAVERIYNHLKPGGTFAHLLAQHGMPELAILDHAETMEGAAERETWHIADQCSAVAWLGGLNKRKRGGYSHAKCQPKWTIVVGKNFRPVPAPVVAWSDWQIEQARLARRKRIARQLLASPFAWHIV